LIGHDYNNTRKKNQFLERFTKIFPL